MKDIFADHPLLSIPGYSCALTTLARALDVEIRDLLLDGAEGGLKIFARPKVWPILVHVNRNLIIPYGVPVMGRSFTPVPPFTAIDGTTIGSDFEAAASVRVRSLEGLSGINEMRIEDSRNLHGLSLTAEHCRELERYEYVQASFFDEVLIRRQGGGLERIVPFTRYHTFLGEELPSYPEWTFAAYEPWQQTGFIAHTGYPYPNGVSVCCDDLFVMDMDVSQRASEGQHNLNEFLNRKGGPEEIAHSESKEFPLKLRLAVKLYRSIWLGKTFSTEGQVREAQKELREQCEQFKNRRLYGPNAEPEDLVNFIENWLTPHEFWGGRFPIVKIMNLPHALKCLLASSELSSLKGGDRASFSRKKLVNFFIEKGFKREEAQKMATFCKF